MKKFVGLAFATSLLAACSNPGGISDEDYNRYKMLGAPKLLYKCNDEISMRWAEGALVTYNALLKRAQDLCGLGKLEILDSKQ